MDVKLGDETAEYPNKQFVFVGSPGTGKSSILALVCFYLAVVKEVQVVWFRVSGDRPVTRFFDQGKYYEWIDKKYESLINLRSGIDHDRCWFCLDGLDQQDIKNRDLGAFFTLLATSGQFRKKGEAGAKQVACLVPYWRQDDLEDLGRSRMMDERDATYRHSVSGGSLRDFLLPSSEAVELVEAALCEITPKIADMLLTPHGCGSDEQIDRIRMMGVADSTSANQYTRLSCWTPCITSMVALKRLADMMDPNFFVKLVAIAKGLNDPRLQGVALEQLFHSHVRCQRCIGLSYLEYDNVDRRFTNTKKRGADSGTINFSRSMESGEGLKYKREGKTTEEQVAMMNWWAEHPDELDYWMPASSDCKTIDAVAKWKFVSDSLKASDEKDDEEDDKEGPVERFCFLQMTKASTHTCDEAVLWQFAEPFVKAGKQVCYMALLFDSDNIRGESAEDKMSKFRLSPVELKSANVKKHIPLYVAAYKLLRGPTSA